MVLWERKVLANHFSFWRPPRRGRRTWIRIAVLQVLLSERALQPGVEIPSPLSHLIGNAPFLSPRLCNENSTENLRKLNAGRIVFNGGNS